MADSITFGDTQKSILFIALPIMAHHIVPFTQIITNCNSNLLSAGQLISKPILSTQGYKPGPQVIADEARVTSEEHLSWVEDVVGVKGVLDGLHGLKADIADLLLHQAAFPNSYAVLPGACAMQFHRQSVTHMESSHFSITSLAHTGTAVTSPSPVSHTHGTGTTVTSQSPVCQTQGKQSLLNHQSVKHRQSSHFPITSLSNTGKAVTSQSGISITRNRMRPQHLCGLDRQISAEKTSHEHNFKDLYRPQ